MKKLRKAYIALIMAFLYAPIVLLILYSFNDSKSRANWGGFTLRWYKELFSDAAIMSALSTTLSVGLLAAVFSTLLGTVGAIALYQMKRLPRKTLLSIVNLPMLNSEVVTGVSLMLLFVAYRGFAAWANAHMGADLVLQNIFGLPTLLIAHISFSVPYVIFNVSPKLRQLDVRMYEAALDLGCNPTQAFFKVVMPELMPAILSAFLICITYSIDDFIISYFTCGNLQTLPIAIYSMTRKKVSPEINALSTIIFLVILAIILFTNHMDSRKYRRDQQQRG